MFLYNSVVFRFHLNLPGCRYNGSLVVLCFERTKALRLGLTSDPSHRMVMHFPTGQLPDSSSS